MKRVLGVTLALVFLMSSAMAAVLTDAPGTPTQDRAVSLQAVLHGTEQSTSDVEHLPADQLTMDTATDVYNFVYEQGNRPVRWYPEDTQEKIAAIADVDPDALHMTELMRLHIDQAAPEAGLDIKMSLDIEYSLGQTLVAVLGDLSDSENPVWTPLPASVTQTGLVEITIPQETLTQLAGKDVLFTLLTVRPAAQETVTAETTEIPEILPSKQAGDGTRVVRTTTKDGEALPDDFDLVIVPETEEIRQEISMLGQHVGENAQSALSWLPQEDQNRVRCLLGTASDTLIVSDYIPLIARGFRHTDGDAVGTLAFATPYQEGQKIVTALGIPQEDATEESGTGMYWSIQPATVRENGVVDIVFDQMALIGMSEETGLLLMFSAPTEGN